MIQGRYFDASSSAAIEAQLDAGTDGTTWLLVNGQRLVVDLSTLEISDRIGRIPRRIHFPDGAEFETSDNDAVDELLGASAPHRGWVNRLERHWGVALGALGAVIAVSFLILKFGLPIVADWAASLLPASTDRIIGMHTLQVLDRGLLRPSKLDPQRKAELQNVFSRMTATMHDGHEYRLELRNSRLLGPNALALPAGIVVMTDQLAKLAENDEELMAVFAHEIGHVRNRHALRQLIEGIGISALAVVVLGDMSSITALASAAPVLLQARNSRELETEADEFSRRWLRDNHIPEQRFDDILCRMVDNGQKQDQKKGPGKGTEPPSFLATHPAVTDRARCN